MTSSLGVLSQLGEVPLRDMGDTSLLTDMLVMNRKLQNTADDVILNMQENMISKKTVSITYEASSEFASRIAFCQAFTSWRYIPQNG